MLFKSSAPHYEYLRKKWVAKHKASSQNLLEKHLKNIAAASLGSLLLLTTPASPSASGNVAQEQTTKITAIEDKNRLLAAELIDKLPSEVQALTSEQENNISQLLTKDFGFKVAAQLDGKRLNRSYGLIGGEQHLYRYPGDNLYAHAKDIKDWAMFSSAGIAPNLGAWGYFAPSKQEFSQKDEQKERWYVVAQTFLSPGFAERTAEYRDFFKYRKMLVVNPKTGQTVVGDIADSGPGEYTGKQFGGSPEVMHELGLASGPRKGEVLFFFIDDPNDTIPLGPIKIQDQLIAKK